MWRNNFLRATVFAAVAVMFAIPQLHAQDLGDEFSPAEEAALSGPAVENPDGVGAPNADISAAADEALKEKPAHHQALEGTRVASAAEVQHHRSTGHKPQPIHEGGKSKAKKKPKKKPAKRGTASVKKPHKKKAGGKAKKKSSKPKKPKKKKSHGG